MPRSWLEKQLPPQRNTLLSRMGAHVILSLLLLGSTVNCFRGIPQTPSQRPFPTQPTEFTTNQWFGYSPPEHKKSQTSLSSSIPSFDATPSVSLRYRSDSDLNGAELCGNDDDVLPSTLLAHASSFRNGHDKANAPLSSTVAHSVCSNTDETMDGVGTTGCPLSTTTSAELSSVVSSVTHWCDIMRQENWLASETINNTSPLLQLDVVLSDEDLSAIEMYWDSIMPTVSYLGTVQVAKIYKALCVAYRSHRGQMRKSGEPFIVHPVEVALLLSGLKMDAETVMSGLLHDTVEDTELTFAQVEALFGVTVRNIVEGETKVSKLPKQLEFSEYADEQAENLRQMFVAMTDDYRIIIVKLADRLHNMRTLRFMKPEKQVMISRETLDIFAPLAHRMGIWQFKSELEDTAFMYLYPIEYNRLNRRLQQREKYFQETLDKAKDLLQRRLNSDPTLKQQAAKVEVFGRRKEIYSLWHKMETKKEHNFENILDIIALRVIITPTIITTDEHENEANRGVWLCYHVLGLVQHLHGFQPVPTKVKDYISFPKPNGYQSLHTALIVDGQPIEVQIRTTVMHQVAEHGMASHWAYTDSKRMKSGSDRSVELYKTPWLSSIKEWQNDRISSRDFVDSVRRELLGKRVFIYLRNGLILNLSRGATVIDAAFQIHTEIGLSMHGAEINGKSVPFSYELCNGDVVSILTGEGKPATDWMRYAKSRSTRSKLRAYFRARQKESLREAGQVFIMDYLWMHRRLIEEESFLKEEFAVPTINVKDIERFLCRTNFEDLDELLLEVGKNHDRSLLHKYVSQMFEVPRKLLIEAEGKSDQVPADTSEDFAGSVYGGTTSPPLKDSESNTLRTQSYIYTVEKLMSKINAPTEYADPEHLCNVCLPVHGDSIVGTRRTNNDPRTTIPTVHRVGCPHAQEVINRAWAGQRQPPQLMYSQTNGLTDNRRPKVDSFTLRNQNWIYKGQRESDIHEVPVKLEWSDLDENNTLFLSEIVIVAEDRRLLLADCSEVVAETVQIVKSGSSSTDEHATLVYLVQVTGLESLQRLIDRLRRVRSVISVERRLASELPH